MLLATWNLNSLRVRLPHLLDWLGHQDDGVVALQELKLEDRDFPADALREAGWQAVSNGPVSYTHLTLPTIYSV